MSDLDDKILKLVPKDEEEVTSVQDILNDEVLQNANNVLILAWDSEDFFYANSNLKRSEAVYLLETAKKYIMDM